MEHPRSTRRRFYKTRLGLQCRMLKPVQTLGIQETIPNEIQELQAKVEQLEERLEQAISILPTSVEPTQIKEMWNRLRYLDHVDSLSEQLLFLEEKLGDCACQNEKNGFGYDLNR